MIVPRRPRTQAPKKKAVPLLFLLLLLLFPVIARADSPGLPGTFTGYFVEKKYIRVKPEPNTRTLGWVPAGTRLEMTPVTDRYALTTYNGDTGYIFYGDVIHDKVEDVVLEGKTVYAREALPAYDRPGDDAIPVRIYPAYTPLEATVRSQEYLGVIDGDSYLYVPATRMTVLSADTAVEPYDGYLQEPAILLSHPLAGAQVLAVLMPPSQIRITGHNGDYLCVSTDGTAGYLLSSAVVRREAEQMQHQYGTLAAATPVYSAPDATSYTETFLSANIVLAFDTSSNGFLRVAKTSQYVKETAVSLFSPEEITPFWAYWTQEEPLYANTVGTLLPTGSYMPANTLIELARMVDGMYLIEVDNVWGYVSAKRLRTIKETSPMEAVAAVTLQDVELLAQPFSFAEQTGIILPSDMPIWLDTQTDDFYRVMQGDQVGYASKMAFAMIGKNVPMETLEVYFDKACVLLDFPSIMHGQMSGIIPDNTLAQAVAKNGTFYYVRSSENEGYVPQNAVKTPDAAKGRAGEGEQRYYLHLNKATRTLTVYLADGNGNRTSEILKTVEVAIGKRSTPTPSGTFTLGEKERWHYFGPSYAPFAIAYTSGRYLHGPLYSARRESALIEARLADFGTMSTGGCLRMPYDDILWIYFHCMTGDTTLEIVNDV